MLRVIHLSDFHLEHSTTDYRKINIIKALLVDLEQYVDDNCILVFTGDAIDKGGKAFATKQDRTNAFQIFEDTFFKPILIKFPNLTNKIFIVPGNHDVFRDKIDPIIESGLKANLKNELGIDNFIRSNYTSSPYLNRLQDYKDWEQRFYTNYPETTLSYFDNTSIVTLGTQRIGIASLNSSWLCKDDSDKEQLIVGQYQVETAMLKLTNCDFKIALLHHPFEFLAEFDREVVQPTIQRAFDLVCLGHVHKLDSTYSQGLYGNIFISIANATIADNPPGRNYVNGYTVIDIVKDEKFVAHHRQYIELANNFVPNTQYGSATGERVYSISKTQAGILSIGSIIDNIRKIHCERLNEHLIIYNSGTKTQCSIDTIFVEPTITNYPQKDIENAELKTYTIDQIINTSNNFLIYGMRESGRTVLLDKMFLELIKTFEKNQKLPILLRFNDLSRKEVEQLVKNFIAESSEDTRKLISGQKLVLLVDDISFDAKYSRALLKLKEFASQNAHVQIIATSKLEIENSFPTTYVEHNNVFNFNVGFIQNLSSSQIKDLIQKWFIGKEVDFHENIEKLIKNFDQLSLPHTPLSVTLFLWIIERQEKRPINNSTLVEMFVENLLEKANFENIYSETFDFHNKQRLLSSIAKYIYDNGDSEYNYRIESSKLVLHIKDYLKGRFTGKAQSILDDFINRGILIYDDEDSLLRFKSAFYFHYFLGKHMDYNPAFKTYVLTDDNYLNFIEEIGYYTGLKRDDIGILDFTQQKLLQAFTQINNDLDNQFEKVDAFFDTKNMVSAHISLEKVKVKPTEKEIENLYDSQLEAIPVKRNIPKKDIQLDDKRIPFDKILKLSAEVLKNSEEVDDFDKKVTAFRNILISSVSFLVLYKMSLINHVKKFNSKPDFLPKNIDINIFIRLLPIIHQITIFNWVGTPKLLPVILHKIERDRDSLNITELEKFISIYMYSDIKGHAYPDVLKEFIKTVAYDYILDLSFVKLISYYFLRSKSKELDTIYLRLMADIKERLGQVNKTKKSEFMLKLEKDKQLKLFSGK